MKIIHKLILREAKDLNVLLSKLPWKERRNIRGKQKHFGVNLKGFYFVMEAHIQMKYRTLIQQQNLLKMQSVLTFQEKENQTYKLMADRAIIIYSYHKVWC